MLSHDFKEFIESLNDNGVRYLVVGGYAVAFHGHPRYTKDLDVWVEPTKENATRLLTAIVHFGFGSLDLTEDDFLSEDEVVQLGHPPNRIDLCMGLTGVSFEHCYRSKVTVKIDDVEADFIGLESLKKNKKASGRTQDLADLENLE